MRQWMKSKLWLYVHSSSASSTSKWQLVGTLVMVRQRPQVLGLRYSQIRLNGTQVTADNFGIGMLHGFNAVSELIGKDRHPYRTLLPISLYQCPGQGHRVHFLLLEQGEAFHSGTSDKDGVEDLHKHQ